MGATIEVVDNPKLMNDRNWNGAACYDDHRIELLPITETTPRHPVNKEQSFCHELMHFLLHSGGGPVNHLMGDKYIHQNDEFVDLMGNLLHQALSTAEYEEPSLPPLYDVNMETVERKIVQPTLCTCPLEVRNKGSYRFGDSPEKCLNCGKKLYEQPKTCTCEKWPGKVIQVEKGKCVVCGYPTHY